MTQLKPDLNTAYFGVEDTNEVQAQNIAINNARSFVAELSKLKGRPLKACVKSFGCQMNARDSEKLSGILIGCGYELSDDEDSDLVIYNTCTVRDSANQRVYGHLGHIRHYKKNRRDMIVAICGCMPQSDGAAQDIKNRFPFIDLIFGTHNIFRFATLLNEVLEKKKDGCEGETIVEIWKNTAQIVESLPVKKKFSYKSGVNIMFGCNNFCTYCIVPYVRGRERSRAPHEIISEIKRLASEGVVEVMLLGQNVNSYGSGLNEPVTFAKLLYEVCHIDGIERVRFMTSHPKDLSDELIEVMASEDKVANHLHLPAQSGSTKILKAMNRVYTKDEYLALVDKIRKKCPDISITTDIIVGFPGETEDDFNETLDLVKKVCYDGAFTFIYSKRSKTPAADMINQVPHDVAQKRLETLIDEVRRISNETLARHVGKTLYALAESVNSKDNSLLSGRLSCNNMVHFAGDASMIGKMIPVKITKQHGFYYTGVIDGTFSDK